jgi:aspartyl-tRNA(Asn)/glutamyl-tRNA(Gln) amidotransferase subunit C
MDINEVKKIAHLARLGIHEQDVTKYQESLSRIFTLFDQLDQIDTNNCQPMAHPSDMVQRLRPDEITETNKRDEYLALAPLSEAGLYLVPAVIE